ncbi:MAG TPA: TlyA family RNA methyltransferase [Thermoplasmata archaeon]|nr:TlyA family RNA methyltransferase [Thermoplasmata archaeon]
MKERLDRLLLKKGMVSSRSQAQWLIRSGFVKCDGQIITKTGRMVSQDSHIEIGVMDGKEFINKGEFKINYALKEFDFSPQGLVAADVGASTGGFTHALLKKGAKRVYAVDVGENQLHPDLRRDSRVISLEKTNVRYLNSLPEKVDLVTIDVSFISLKLVLPVVKNWLKEKGHIVALIKPQFELQDGERDKRGVVVDEVKRKMAVENVLSFCRKIGLEPLKLVDSPLPGKKGNQEFFVLLKS